MSELTFDPGSLRTASSGMNDAAQDLLAKTESVLSACGDLSVLGTNDTLGGVAQMLYGAVLDRVRETVDSLAEGMADHGEKLSAAADLYAQTEADNAAASQDMVAQ